MYVYILESLKEQKKYYTGISTNCSKRLSEHNWGKSKHSNKYKPWKIIAQFWFEDDETAENFEKYLKSGSGRAFIKKHFMKH